MSALLDMARPPTLFDPGVVDAPALDRPRTESPAADPARSLATVLDGAWEELAAGRSAACLVCGEDMAPVYGAGALPLGGRCGGCGSRLG